MEDNDRNEELTIDTSSVIISEEGSREELVYVNNSTTGQKITLSIGAPAQLGAGVLLFPGYAYYASKAQGFSPTKKRIWAIADGAGAILSVMERRVV